MARYKGTLKGRRGQPPDGSDGHAGPRIQISGGREGVKELSKLAVACYPDTVLRTTGIRARGLEL